MIDEENDTRQHECGLVETTKESEVKTEKMAPITGTENQMKEKNQINPETDPRQNASGSENTTSAKVMPKSTAQIILKEDIYNDNGSSTCDLRIPTVPVAPHMSATSTSVQADATVINVTSDPMDDAQRHGGTMKTGASVFGGLPTITDVVARGATPTRTVTGSGNAKTWDRELVESWTETKGVLELQVHRTEEEGFLERQEARRAEDLDAVLAQMRTIIEFEPVIVDGAAVTCESEDYRFHVKRILNKVWPIVTAPKLKCPNCMVNRVYVGKTWYQAQATAMGLAIRAAAAIKPSVDGTPPTVVYVSSENSERWLRLTARDVAAAMGVSIPQNLLLMGSDSQKNQFGDFWSQAKRRLVRMQPSMIFLENYSRLYVRQLLLSSETTDLSKTVRKVLKSTKASIVVVSLLEHSPRSDIAYQYAGWPDMAVTFTGLIDNKFRVVVRDEVLPRGEKEFLVSWHDPLMVVSEDPTKALRQPVKDTESRGSQQLELNLSGGSPSGRAPL